MENKIKVTKDLKFSYEDLMKTVDVSHEFTLRDIIRSCVNSSIPMEILEKIFECPYITDYFKESENHPFTGTQGEIEIDYLEVYWSGFKQTYDGKRCDDGGWSFHGIGKEGYIPEDMLKYGNIKWKKGEKKHYRQAIAIELSPIYTIADYPIRISNKIFIEDYDARKIENYQKYIDFQPNIKLIDLLYAILFELSFFGSPEDRNIQFNDMKGRMDEISKASQEGRLDEITIPWEKVKKDLDKLLKKNKKETKKG